MALHVTIVDFQVTLGLVSIPQGRIFFSEALSSAEASGVRLIEISNRFWALTTLNVLENGPTSWLHHSSHHESV